MDSSTALSIILVGVSYLCGSVASAIIVCRLMGLPDPRSGGSGNPGATNVLRLGGKGPAALTLLGDVLKGVIPVLVAAGSPVPVAVQVACGLAAFVGHLFPVFFRFQGGKGFATALGVVVALHWQSFLSMGLTWLIVAALFRFSSLASLCAAIAAPAAAWLLGAPASFVWGLGVMAVLLFWRHKGNIQRLLAGTESRIGQKAKG